MQTGNYCSGDERKVIWNKEWNNRPGSIPSPLFISAGPIAQWCFTWWEVNAANWMHAQSFDLDWMGSFRIRKRFLNYSVTWNTEIPKSEGGLPKSMVKATGRQSKAVPSPLHKLVKYAQESLLDVQLENIFFCKEMYRFRHIYHFLDCGCIRQQGRAVTGRCIEQWERAGGCPPQSKGQRARRKRRQGGVLDPSDCNPPGSSVHGIFPGKNTAICCCILLQGIFPTERESVSCTSCFGTAPPGKPRKVAVRTVKSDQWSPFCIRANSYPRSSPPLAT